MLAEIFMLKIESQARATTAEEAQPRFMLAAPAPRQQAAPATEAANVRRTPTAS